MLKLELSMLAGHMKEEIHNKWFYRILKDHHVEDS